VIIRGPKGFSLTTSIKSRISAYLKSDSQIVTDFWSLS